MTEEGVSSPPSKWRENHGNFLIGFVVLVLVIGAGLVAYRQSQSHSSQSPPDVKRMPAVYAPPQNPAEDASPVEGTEPAGGAPAASTVDTAVDETPD